MSKFECIAKDVNILKSQSQSQSKEAPDRLVRVPDLSQPPPGFASRTQVGEGTSQDAQHAVPSTSGTQRVLVNSYEDYNDTEDRQFDYDND